MYDIEKIYNNKNNDQKKSSSRSIKKTKSKIEKNKK